MSPIFPLIDPDRDGQQAVDDFLDSLLEQQNFLPLDATATYWDSQANVVYPPNTHPDLPYTSQEKRVQWHVQILDYIRLNGRFRFYKWDGKWYADIVVLNKVLSGAGLTKEDAQQELLAWIWNWPEARNHVLGL